MTFIWKSELCIVESCACLGLRHSPYLYYSNSMSNFSFDAVYAEHRGRASSIMAEHRASCTRLTISIKTFALLITIISLLLAKLWILCKVSQDISFTLMQDFTDYFIQINYNLNCSKNKVKLYLIDSSS